MYSYYNLEKILKKKNIKKSELSSKLGISSRTIAKIKKGEKISRLTLEKIAHYINCDSNDLISYKSDNKLLQILQDEKYAKISGGIYHELQIRMTYNSNHIEGNKLTEDQTRFIFETNTIDTNGSVLVDDILETVNHFHAIDYVIENAEKKLDEEIIKELHKILKQNTKDSTLEWFSVGDYKQRPNVIGETLTTAPENVQYEMKKLINEYNSNENIAIEDIIKFHAKFEKIHPFQDGNGRVGRLISFKECLYHKLVPFIIEDEKKYFYYRGLSNWNDEESYLIDTCLDGQDTFKKMLVKYNIEV